MYDSSGYKYPALHLSAEAIRELLTVLEAHHLFFPVQLAPTGTVWKTLRAAVDSHLTHHGFIPSSLPEGRVADPDVLEDCFFQLLVPSTKESRNEYPPRRAITVKTIVGSEFTSSNLAKIAKPLKDPIEGHGSMRLIWLGELSARLRLD